MRKRIDNRNYLLLDDDLNVKETVTEKELREKYKIRDVSKFLNSSDIPRINGLTVVEDYDVEETAVFHENDTYKYVISENANIFRYNKKTHRREKVSIIKRGNNRGLFVLYEGREKKLEKIMVENFASDLPENYRIQFIDGNKYHCELDNIRVKKITTSNKKSIFKNREEEARFNHKISKKHDEYVKFEEGNKFEYYINSSGEGFRKNKCNGRRFPIKPFCRRGNLMIKINGRERMLSHIVADTFIDQRPDVYLVEYRDGNRENCSMDNLIIVDKREKVRNTIGQIPPTNRREVGIFKDDVCINRFQSIKEASNYIGIKYNYARSIINKKNIYGLRYI